MREAAAYLHVSTQSVRKYEKAGLLECYRTPAGHRRFSKEQLDTFLGKQPKPIYAFYARSSNGSEDAIKNQYDKMKNAYGEPAYKYKDKASGLNENRPGLWKMVKDAQNKKFTHLIITNPDRLTRFGYKYLEELLKTHNVEIICTEELKDKTMYDELMQDFMSLIASFSGKFYKIRSKENKKRLLEKAEEALNAS